MRRLAAGLAVVLVLANSIPADAFVPTDDAAGFLRFDLYGDRVAAVSVLDHRNITGYPASLNSDFLLVTRSPGSIDTVGQFNSEPYDGIYFEVNGSASQSYVEYAVTPPRYATALGLLANGVNIYNSTGAFNDFGKPLLRATVTYTNGDTAVRTLHVGHHIRDYFNSGPLTCGAMNHPLYIARPSDPLSGHLFEGGGYFYDVQEQSLPVEEKRVSRIRIDGILLDHFCSTFVPHIYAGSQIFGLSAWPEFSIVNGTTPVVLQTQYNPTWAGDAYGGYMYNDTLVGQHRTLGEFGCVTACLSMANNYYGAAATPRTVNQFLQGRNDGHFYRTVTQISSVAGDNVSFTLLPQSGTVGPTFLIERGRNSPLATVSVVSIMGTTGTGTITQRFQGGDVQVGDYGFVYDEVNYLEGSAGFSTGTWQVTGLKPKSDDTVAALAESTLATNTPVFLYTGVDAGGATHWVVGEGREPAFTSATVARGTYRIKDPAYTDGGAQPLRRLLQVPHNNTFQAALVCTALTSEIPPLAASGVSGQGLALRVQGNATLEIVDPTGKTITYDAARDRYASGIPHAIALRRFRLIAPSNPSISTGVSEILQIPDAATGSYFIKVAGQAGESYVLRAVAMAGSGLSSRAILVETSAGSPQYYRMEYTATTVSTPTPTAVPDVEAPVGRGLRIQPNPVIGVAEIRFDLKQASDVELGIYDLQGRRVASLLEGTLSPGPKVLRWDGRGLSGTRVGAGIYLVRFVSDGLAVVRRIVVVK
jgi:hypothetical protein